MKPTQHKKRTTANSSGQNKVNFSPVAEVDEVNPHVELTSEEDLKNEITELKVTIVSLEEDIKDKIKKLSEKDEIFAKSKFCIDRFKHNQVHFKFYTGFDSYGQFKCVLEYLQPAASMLSYWESGRKSNIEKIEPSGKKAGRTRSLNPEEEFFLTLTRLRCGFPIMDVAIRFNMSTGNISRILVTWFDFLHSQFRMLPIWASKNTSREPCRNNLRKHTLQ